MRGEAQLALLTVPAASEREADKAIGRVYTPPELAALVLAQAGYGVGSVEGATLSIENVNLLDPACGDGVFLTAAVGLIAERLVLKGVDVTTSVGRRRLVDAVSAQLHGVDIDPVACAKARENVRRAVAAVTKHEPSNKFFARNVRCHDFLTDDVEYKAELVVGNPPYVPVQLLSSARRRELALRYQSAWGRLDLYIPFFERATEIVSVGGRVAFITPEKLLTSYAARRLRDLLTARGRVLSIAHFRSHQVFPDAATVPCVTVFERVPHAGTNSPVDVVTVVPNPKKRGAFRVASRTRIRSERLQSPVWSVASDDLQELARRLEVSGLPLEAHVGRISAGIATGRDRIFVRRAADLDGVEEALRYGVIRGRSIRRFEVAPSDEEIVVPYERSGDTLKLVDIRHYRGAESYLRAYGEELRQRHCVRTWNKVWYDLHDPLPAGAFEAPKIVVPDIARESRFAVDDEGRVPLHSVYYATVRRVDPYFLSAVLNSRPAQFLMRLRSPIMKDGFSRYRRQFLASLPVPVCSGTDQCAINDCLADGDITGVSERIEKLFGLSAKDGALITRYLAST